MQSLSSLALGFGVVFSSAFLAGGSPSPISNGPTTRSLASRQAPGVVAASDFLRRAGHACRLTTLLNLLASKFRTDFSIAVVAGNWVYIDGGEFSFMSDGNPNYQYCTVSVGVVIIETIL